MDELDEEIAQNKMLSRIENLNETLARDTSELVELVNRVGEDVFVEKPPAKIVANVRMQIATVRRRLASLEALLSEIER